MKKNTKEMLLVLPILVIVSVVYAVLLRPFTKTGVLYMLGNEQPVCSGTLITSRNPYGGESAKFKCTDGREINRLTNYMLKEN